MKETEADTNTHTHSSKNWRDFCSKFNFETKSMILVFFFLIQATELRSNWIFGEIKCYYYDCFSNWLQYIYGKKEGKTKTRWNNVSLLKRHCQCHKILMEIKKIVFFFSSIKRCGTSMFINLCNAGYLNVSSFQ